MDVRLASEKSWETEGSGVVPLIMAENEVGVGSGLLAARSVSEMGDMSRLCVYEDSQEFKNPSTT
jgi:hypothetical protein